MAQANILTGSEAKPYTRKEARTLLASEARTASETGGYIMMPPDHTAMIFELDVTAAATDGGDTLNIEIYAKMGDNNVEIVHFAEVLGNGGAKRFYAKIMAQTAEALFGNTALAAGTTVRHLLSTHYYADATIVDTGTDDASFTFSVIAIPL